MAAERIQKLMAAAGLGSRRACEDLITQGRVKVNGKTAVLGAKADPIIDLVEVDGNRIKVTNPGQYIAFNKPRKVLSGPSGQDDRETIWKYLPKVAHLFCVGRLDYDSEGLMIITDDGNITNRLTHPRYGHEKEYLVQLIAKPDDEQLQIWRRGVVLEDGYRTAPAKVLLAPEIPGGFWVKIILTEGRKRQIRETGQRLGLPVLRIKRVRIGPVNLGRIKPGEWRNPTREEIHALKTSVKADPKSSALNVKSGRSKRK